MNPFHHDNRFQDIVMFSLYWGQYLRDTYGEGLIPYLFMWNGEERFTNVLQAGGDPEEFAYRIASETEREFQYFAVGYEGMLGSGDGPPEKALIVKAYKKNQDKGVFLAQLFTVDANGKFNVNGDPMMVDTPKNPLELDSNMEEKPYEDVVTNGIVVANEDGLEKYLPFFLHDNPAAISGSIKNYVRQKLATADKKVNSGEFEININPSTNGSAEFMKYVILDTVMSEKHRPTTKSWEQMTGRKVAFDVRCGDEMWLKEIAHDVSNTVDTTNKSGKNPTNKEELESQNSDKKEVPTKDTSPQKADYIDEYKSLSAMELKREVNRLRSDPNARTNVDSLIRMTALMSIMEERGIDLPGQRKSPRYEETANVEKEKSSRWGLYVLAVVVILIIKVILRNM